MLEKRAVVIRDVLTKLNSDYCRLYMKVTRSFLCDCHRSGQSAGKAVCRRSVILKAFRPFVFGTVHFVVLFFIASSLVTISGLKLKQNKEKFLLVFFLIVMEIESHTLHISILFQLSKSIWMNCAIFRSLAKVLR